jgi:hypothetical protein
MKKQNKITLAALTFVACLLPNEAQPMATGGACVTGNIVLSVISSPLDYAVVDACSASSGTVAIKATNGALTTGGCISATTGISATASIRIVAGQASNSTKIFVRAPNSATIVGGGDSMSLSGLQLGVGGGKQTYTMGGKATATIGVGGTLNVGAGQPGGSYSGTANVTATCL